MTLAVNITTSLQNGFDKFFGFLPNILGFLIILIIGYIVARVVKGVITKVFQKVGLDKALHSGQTGEYVERLSPGASPSALIGSVAFWLIFVFVLSAAINALKIASLTVFMTQVIGFLPNVIVAIVILAVAGAISGAIAGAVAKTMGDTPTGKVVATAIPVLVLGIAVFMALNQLHVAKEIVTLTYAFLFGAVALGMALAFGLGGREVASKMLNDAYSKGQEKKDQVKDDMQTGKERGQNFAEEGKQKAQAEVGQGGAGGTGGTGSGGTGSSSAQRFR